VSEALKNSGKEKAQELNLLEILNSYDQLISKLVLLLTQVSHNLTPEDCTKVYKRIL